MSARALDDGVEQEPFRIEMLVDVHVQWKSASIRELEQEVEERDGLIGILGHPADRIRPGGDCALEPLPRCIEPVRRVGGQMSDDLQRKALATVLAQLHHCLEPTQLRLGFDVGVAADRHRSMCQADIEGLLSPRNDVFVGDRGGKRAVAGRGSLQRGAGIGDRAPRARLVEMLMGVDQSLARPACR